MIAFGLFSWLSPLLDYFDYPGTGTPPLLGLSSTLVLLLTHHDESFDQANYHR